MKTFTNLFLVPILAGLFCFGISNTVFAQGVGDHVTMSLRNATATANTITFDLYITSDGASNSDIRPSALSYGVNFNSSIIPSGATISAITNINTNANFDPLFPQKGYTLRTFVAP